MNPRRLGFKTVDVNFGTFDYTVQVIAGPHKNLEKYIRWKLNWPEFEAGDMTMARGRCFHREGWVPVVWIPRYPKTPREHGTLAHEFLHAIRFMLQDWAGMPLTYDTDEAYCHAMSYAMAEALEGLK